MKNLTIKTLIVTVSAVVLANLTGCATVANTMFPLADNEILSATAPALGYAPADLTIEDNRLGNDANQRLVDLQAKNGKEFTCLLFVTQFTGKVMATPNCVKKGQQPKFQTMVIQ